jgi:hypothetical protein
MSMRVALLSVLFALCALWTSPAWADDGPPALPPGLEDEPDVPLPEGLGDGMDVPGLPEGLDETDAPGLPEGLDETDTEETPADEPPRTIWNDAKEFGLRGFLELRMGAHTRQKHGQRDASLAEARLQIGFEKQVGDYRIDLVTDLIADGLAEDRAVDLEAGRGWLDLRQASVSFSPLEFLDLKVGRQILTWGTGDLLFLNDMFPKDWQSFLLGRDTEYLKGPSDAVKASVFLGPVDIDIVYTPRFDADRFITGERVTYFDSAMGRFSGHRRDLEFDRPDDWFEDDEVALRLSGNIDSVEAALYAYDGFWKSPAGMNRATGDAVFPKLRVYGASARSPLAGGIASVEAAWFDSRDDADGDDPFVENGQVRLLVGFERDLPELAHDLTVGVQWYLESMRNHGDYERGLPPGVSGKDANRQVLTLRVTKRLMSQTLDLSLFAFVSPTDSDGYLRLSADYQIDDHWSAFAGAGIFVGKDDHTFFGQFEPNTNVHAGVRWAF